MVIELPPTRQELLAAYTRSGLWLAGVQFEAALARPLVLWAMKKSALAARRRDRLPVQPALF